MKKIFYILTFIFITSIVGCSHNEIDMERLEVAAQLVNESVELDSGDVVSTHELYQQVFAQVQDSMTTVEELKNSTRSATPSENEAFEGVYDGNYPTGSGSPEYIVFRCLQRCNNGDCGAEGYVTFYYDPHIGWYIHSSGLIGTGCNFAQQLGF